MLRSWCRSPELLEWLWIRNGGKGAHVHPISLTARNPAFPYLLFCKRDHHYYFRGDFTTRVLNPRTTPALTRAAALELGCAKEPLEGTEKSPAGKR